MFRINIIILILLCFSLLGFVPMTIVDAHAAARIRVKVTEAPGGYGIPGAEINVTDPAIYSDCDGCGTMTNSDGIVVLIFTGEQQPVPTQITVEASGVPGFPPTSDTTLVVNFATVDLEIVLSRFLTVYGGGDGNGTITSIPGGISCTISGGFPSGACSQEYDWGTEVTLTASPAAGSAFTGWNLDCNGPGECKVTMDFFRSVTATFSILCGDLGGDTDGDEVCDNVDNCPAISNPGQDDSDDDGAGDPCDNCPGMINQEQSDFNNNGIGDACECEGDLEPDGDCDETDLLSFSADFGRINHIGDIQGDFDLDGDCDGFDFSIFTADFGRMDCLIPPSLIYPIAGYIVDNGCSDFSNPKEWNFYWSSLPNASKYHIYSIHPNATMPVIDQIVNTNNYNFLNYGYVPNINRFNWSWKVRSGNDAGQWSEWSENSYFDVELVDTDCP